MSPSVDLNNCIPVANLAIIINNRIKSLNLPDDYQVRPNDFIPQLVAITNLPFCKTELRTFVNNDTLTPAGGKLIVALLPEELQEFIQYDLNSWFFSKK